MVWKIVFKLQTGSNWSCVYYVGAKQAPSPASYLYIYHTPPEYSLQIGWHSTCHVLLIPFEEDLAPCSFLKILYRTFSSAESSLENDASYLALSIALKTDSIETSSSNLLNTRTYWLYVKMATFVFSFEISKSLTRSLANFLVFPNTSSDTLPELSSRITMSIFSWHLNSAPMDQNCCYILF